MNKIIAEEIEFLTSLSTYYSAPARYSNLPSTTISSGSWYEMIDRETRIASRKFVLYVNLILYPQKGIIRGKKTVYITIKSAIAAAAASVFDIRVYRIIDDKEYILSGYNLVHHKDTLRLIPIYSIDFPQGPELRIMRIE